MGRGEAGGFDGVFGEGNEEAVDSHGGGEGNERDVAGV